MFIWQRFRYHNKLIKRRACEASALHSRKTSIFRERVMRYSNREPRWFPRIRVSKFVYCVADTFWWLQKKKNRESKLSRSRHVAEVKGLLPDKCDYSSGQMFACVIGRFQYFWHILCSPRSTMTDELVPWTVRAPTLTCMHSTLWWHPSPKWTAKWIGLSRNPGYLCPRH